MCPRETLHRLKTQPLQLQSQASRVAKGNKCHLTHKKQTSTDLRGNPRQSPPEKQSFSVKHSHNCHCVNHFHTGVLSKARAPQGPRTTPVSSIRLLCDLKAVSRHTRLASPSGASPVQQYRISRGGHEGRNRAGAGELTGLGNRNRSFHRAAQETTPQSVAQVQSLSQYLS